MLGKTAGGLFWMFRYLERAENIARLVEAGWRIALTRAGDTENEWESVVTTAGMRSAYCAKFDDFDSAHVINYLLRNPERDVTNTIDLAPYAVVGGLDKVRMDALHHYTTCSI